MVNVPTSSRPALGDAQWTHVQALADTLNNDQLSWLSGYFAGVARGRQPDGAQAPAPAAAEAPPAQGTASGARPIVVLYGTETGNSAAVAQDLAARLGERGHAVTLRDMADCKPAHLREAQDLLCIASTYGDGDPPQPAVGFFEFLEGRKAPRFDGVRYAVLALGDSTYERFCAAGRRLDERLAGLGAQALLPRVDCDVDFEESAAAWIQALLPKLAPVAATAAVVQAVAQPEAAPAGYDKRNPFPARVLDNLVLTGRDSSKEVRHLELSLEGSGLRYEPGDAIGLRPRNAPEVVHALLGQLGLSENAGVALKGRHLTLGEAFASELDIVNVTPRFLEHWGRLSASAELEQLALPDRAAERAAFAQANHVIDVIRRLPAKGLDAQAVAQALRPLQPRLYSIASSQAAVSDEVHLTVSALRYDLYGQARAGVASGYLAAHAGPDAEIGVYIQSAPHFRLPAGDVPIIMIGAGTGVAPYRAFMQEREVQGATGRAWLFFGERQFRTDFLYQLEWQDWLKSGVLDHMDVAFSRDASNGAGKAYVWHRLRERAREIYGWLEEGAHVYVCGDAARMAVDVHRTLSEIIVEQGGRDEEGAHDYLRGLQDAHRYQRDVY